MPISARIRPLLVAVLTAGLFPACAQAADGPRPFVPRQPQTRQELNQREALKLYAFGLICQRDDRLLEALRYFEKAVQLDPQAASLHKVRIPLYLALERNADALAACRKVVALDPGDYQTWFVYSRQLKTQGQFKEARTALAQGVRCKKLKKHPEMLQQMFFELGILHEGLRELEQAAAAFEESARVLDRPEALMEAVPFSREEIDARAADLYERIGRISVQAKKYDRAVAAFRKAQAKASDRAGRLNYNLAEVCHAQGKDRDALAYLDSYLQLQPQGLEAYEMKIALLKKLNRQKEILPALARYVANDRYNTGLTLLLARQYEVQGYSSKAEDIYLQLAKGPPTAEVYRSLFNLYKNSPRKGMTEVLRLLDDALKRAGSKENEKENESERTAAAATARVMLAVLRDDAGLIKPLLEVGRRQTLANKKLAYQTRHFLAVLAGRAHQLEVAERFYRGCLDEVTRDNEAAVYGGLLKVLWQAHKYKAIVEICRKGLAKTQNTSPVLFHLDLAQALPYLDKSAEALKHADKAVEAAGDDIKLFTRLRRVSVLSRLERYDQAVAECQELLKKYTQASDVHDIRYTLSGVYTAARNFARAEEELQRIIKAHPDDATAYNDLGYIWADQNKNVKQAEEYIRKAVDLDRKQKKTGAAVGTDEDQDNAAYIDSLGWVLFRRGQLDAARKELEKASSLPNGDDDPVVWDHLGDVYFRLGQSARARAAWRKSVTLYEVEKRRKMDQRYQEIKQKLKLLERETQP